jgi:hypothetical protein
MYRIQSGEFFGTTFQKSFRFTFPTCLCEMSNAGMNTTKIPTCNRKKKGIGAARLPITPGQMNPDANHKAQRGECDEDPNKWS